MLLLFFASCDGRCVCIGFGFFGEDDVLLSFLGPRVEYVVLERLGVS
jgi:hypothetical protein